jgi:hypothetical protein
MAREFVPNRQEFILAATAGALIGGVWKGIGHVQSKIGNLFRN